MVRRTLTCLAFAAAPTLVAAPALACGGLIGPRGSVNLIRTSTLAGYHSGIEHYVTSFTFTGQGGGKFGSIVPLPGVPSNVERGGDWTLQRLEREVTPVSEGSAAGSAALVPAPLPEVLLEAKIDALDITVLKGGGAEVARWARANGFTLSPDAPEVLDFYAARSPIFMAARFNQARAQARGQLAGDGTPIHVTIPTPTPWVPLRILGLGKQPQETIDADVFLLTDRAPSILPVPSNVGARGAPTVQGITIERSESADVSLLRDLHADKGMGWVPTKGMWFSYLKISTPASVLRNDLAIDASGAGHPSFLAAGFGHVSGITIPPIVNRIVQRVVLEGPLSTPVPARSRLPDISAALLLGTSIGALAGFRLRRHRVSTT